MNQPLPVEEIYEDEDQRSALDFCRSRLGAPDGVLSRPGNRRQPTFRAALDGRGVILTRRKDPRRAALEHGVLRELRQHGAPVPEVLAFNGTWLIQEDLGTERLSQALARSSAAECRRLLCDAIASLAKIQTAARDAGLADRVAAIGGRPGWLENLIAAPERVGRMTGCPAPGIAASALNALLASKHRGFIKWDARPGNAIVRADGGIGWIDWEHCGRRNPLDDLGWLLGDEYCPGPANSIWQTLDPQLDAFAQGTTPQEMRDYLNAFTTLHMCKRLELILVKKGEGPWWNAEHCLAEDKVGVTPTMTIGLCRRAADWAGRLEATSTLSSWFDRLAERILIERAQSSGM